MNMRGLYVSIVLAFLVGCSHRNSDARAKQKGLTRPDQPVSDTTKSEDLPAQGESVTKVESGYEIRGPAAQKDLKSPVIKLESGKELKVLAAGKIYYAQGKPGWMFKYETKLKIDDVPALQKEAEEIWPLLKKDVEKEGYESAILSANEPPKGSTGGVFLFLTIAVTILFS